MSVQTDHRSPRSLAPHAVALLVYALLCSIVTWPLLLHLRTHLPAIPGEAGEDVWQHAWNIWWVSRALLVEITNPYYTMWLFYPEGASLYLHSLNLPVGLIAMPLLPATGLVVTYNLVTLLVMVAAGYGSFLLAQHITHNNPAALLAGAIVVCSPQRFFELRSAQLATLSDYGIPLALLCVLIALERRTWRWVVLVAFALLVTGLSKWYHLFHMVLVLAPLFAWRVVAAWRSGGRAAVLPELVPWGNMAGVSALFIAPFVLPGIVEALNAPYEPPSMVFYAPPDVLLPDTFGGIWHPAPPGWRDPHTFSLVALLCALAGLLLAPRRAFVWATIAVVCLVMSFGASLHIESLNLDVPMPYLLFQSLPVSGLLRAPYRINSVTTLMMGLVAACGLARLLHSSLDAARGGWLVSMGVIVLLAVETIRLPFALDDARISPFYQQIANQPGAWSVMELPFNRLEHRMEMYAQTYHGKYILTGKTSRNMVRMPHEKAAPLAQVGAGSLRPDIVRMSPTERNHLLRGLRVYYVVFHDDPQHPDLDERQVEVARQVIGPLTSVYSDTHMQAYRLDAVADWLDGAGRTVREDVPLFLGLDDRWYAAEHSHNRDGVSRWLPPDGAGFWAYTPHPRRAVLDVSLYSLPGRGPLEIWLNGQHVQTLAIAEGHTPRHYLSAPLPLAAGTNMIELRAPEGGIRPSEAGMGDDTRELSFSVHSARLREVVGN